MRRLLDDETLPAGDPFYNGAIVNGEFVPLDRFVQVPDKMRTIALPPLTQPEEKETAK
jgi:hypothetical protein